MSKDLPLMYTDLADWFPLITMPSDYAEEAELYRRTLLEARPGIHTLLELGSGGGNNASHLKKHFDLTLVDLSPKMLALSKRLNPELPHHHGDMRSVRLARTFDAVFIHDAIMYLTTEDDLRQAMATAAAHLLPGGVALLVPDHTKETYRDSEEVGGNDGNQVEAEFGDHFRGRSVRYLEWTYNPNPAGTVYTVDFAYLLREEPDKVRCVYDRHIFGVFSRATWLGLMDEAGFDARILPFELSDVAPGLTEMVLGVKR